MSKQKKSVKIMAILALFWIIVWIIWTGILIIFSSQNSNEQTLTEEQYLDIQKYINSQTWSVDGIETINLTWSTEENIIINDSIEINNNLIGIETLTWETK